MKIELRMQLKTKKIVWNIEILQNQTRRRRWIKCPLCLNVPTDGQTKGQYHYRPLPPSLSPTTVSTGNPLGTPPPFCIRPRQSAEGYSENCEMLTLQIKFTLHISYCPMFTPKGKLCFVQHSKDLVSKLLSVNICFHATDCADQLQYYLVLISVFKMEIVCHTTECRDQFQNH